MAAKPKNEKKKMNPLLWFLFAIVIPGVIALTLAIIILTVAGVDVVGWAKEKGNDVPVLASVITTDEEKDKQRTEDQMQEMITSKDEEIAALNQQVTDLESAVDEMEREIIRLENEEAPDEEKTENEQTPENESLAAISSSFSDMDNEQAAQILQNMDQDLAVSILEDVPNDARGEILEEMEPDYAAALTQMFVNETQ
ncbi:MotE family protein [Lentibacillus sp. CBA3610]|uniref:MotE family protein n=1 Tax=Lentibacillus sp. CBA3610 TaxID=2518176 RepID=UPI0015958FEF|nr:hypothetical protein [Lentibacillus sp. CBA3610]QKY69034.1 hypothetical protein Len3610_04895 [Lentibacillus sp. CBA3610]